MSIRPSTHDIVHPHSRRVEQPDDMVSAAAVAFDVPENDLPDIVTSLAAVLGRTDHGRPRAARDTLRAGNGGQCDQVIAGVTTDVLDENIVAPQAKIDSVLVQDGPSLTVDDFESAGLEVDIPQRAVSAAFQRDRPAMGIMDGHVLDAEALDKRQQDADIPPIPALALARNAGIGPVGPGADRLAAVAGGSRTVCSLEHRAADAADMNVLQGLDVRDAEAAVRAAQKVVSATVGEFDPAVVQFQRGVAAQQDGRVDQPDVAPLLAAQVISRDDHAAAGLRSRGNGEIDSFHIRALELIGRDDPRPRVIRRSGCRTIQQGERRCRKEHCEAPAVRFQSQQALHLMSLPRHNRKTNVVLVFEGYESFHGARMGRCNRRLTSSSVLRR